ncbi:MAG: TraX family protein [Eubacterium sp.]
MKEIWSKRINQTLLFFMLVMAILCSYIAFQYSNHSYDLSETALIKQSSETEESRNKAVIQRIRTEGETSEARELLSKNASLITVPIIHKSFSQWEYLMPVVEIYRSIVILLCAFLAAEVFSKRRQDGIGSGVCIGILNAVFVYILCMGTQAASYFPLTGVHGWNVPIQAGRMSTSIYHLTFGKFYALIVLSGLVIALFATSLVMLLSLMFKVHGIASFIVTLPIVFYSIFPVDDSLWYFLSPCRLLMTMQVVNSYQVFQIGKYVFLPFPFLIIAYGVITFGLLILAFIVGRRKTTVSIPENWRILDGGILKKVACATMLCDHIGGVILENIAMTNQGKTIIGLDNMNMILKSIGRFTFPVFCLGLVEGFMHTRNRVRYAGRLLLFAVISEIPFDLAFSGKIVAWDYQNVMFELLAGLLMIWILDYLWKRSRMNMMLKAVSMTGIFLGVYFGTGYQLGHFDYGGHGMMLILILYITYSYPILRSIAGTISMWWISPASCVPFIAMLFYNGKRGKQNKYYFYWFYPVHLLLLYIVLKAVLKL